MRFDKIEFTAAYGTAKQLPPSNLPEIVFSGRSNVGKSSLINKVFNRKNLARVSSMPGKTITVNFFKGDGVIFADLPGYGYAKRSKEHTAGFSGLTDAYFTKNPSADQIKMVLQLIDVRTGPTDDDLMMIQYLVDTGYPFVVVATKTDKLSKTAVNAAIEQMQKDYFSEVDIRIIPFSSVTREGKEAVLNVIQDAVSQ